MLMDFSNKLISYIYCSFIQFYAMLTCWRVKWLLFSKWTVGWYGIHPKQPFQEQFNEAELSCHSYVSFDMFILPYKFFIIYMYNFYLSFDMFFLLDKFFTLLFKKEMTLKLTWKCESKRTFFRISKRMFSNGFDCILLKRK